MRLLFDQNSSYRVVKQLKPVLPDIAGVQEVGLLDADDYEIWEYARQQNYTIVTFDRDIPMIGSVRGFPPKIIWLRNGNANNLKLISLITNRIGEFQAFINRQNKGCLLVYNSHSVDTITPETE
jgi:predicted nuclease of predicted toxin-antitoxin system